MRALFIALAVMSADLPPPEPRFAASIDPLAPPVRAHLRSEGFWRSGCPVPMSDLRLLSVTYWGFDDRAHNGQVIVNESAARPLAKVFGRLFELRFPIRHMRLSDQYGDTLPLDEKDISGSFDCSKAKPSPCDPGASTGWSNHAYGLAIDLNPVENPYTCGGRAFHRESEPYMDRSRMRRGMVTPEVVRAFRSVGWEWGGDWPGSTKDYTHFSASGS
jgi:D-alanyl-D-alanine carboxypeptidase